MNSLGNLRSFVTVAREGTLAAAAERLALTQAAVSLQLRALEAELKRTLFDRGGRRLALNAAGRELLPRAQHMLSLYDELRGVVDAGPGHAAAVVGQYRVGTIVSAVAPLSHAVVALKRRHPQLEIKLTVAKSIELSALCASGSLDAAITVRGEGGSSRELKWTPLYDEPLVVLAHPGVRGRHAARVLREEPFLRFDRQQSTGVLIQRTLRRLGLRPAEFLELNAIEALVELVRQRVGVALLPRLRGASWDSDPALRVLLLAQPQLAREVGLMQRRDGNEMLAQAVIAALAEP
ncbi:MAG TPA: LysR family transcriptional regulator [Burkholderiaceae bacterium]|nr:LysR family transcriptional regulator [Burkholderiaceae bacterium]